MVLVTNCVVSVSCPSEDSKAHRTCYDKDTLHMLRHTLQFTSMHNVR